MFARAAVIAKHSQTTKVTVGPRVGGRTPEVGGSYVQRHNAPMPQREVRHESFERVSDLIDALPREFDPLDPRAIDGFVTALSVLPIQPSPAQWWRVMIDPDSVVDTQGPAWRSEAVVALQTVVAQHAAEVDAAVGARRWFDPWVQPPVDEDEAIHDCVRPWVLGFATAIERFLEPGAHDTHPDAVAGFALVYSALDREDIDDAALLEAIDALEPPATLDEAVEDLVSGAMLIADVTRPSAATPSRARPAGARMGSPGRERSTKGQRGPKRGGGSGRHRR
jgi:uncharacterized protein